MEATYRRCCGIDVHKKSVMICILPPAGERKGEPLKRKFRTYTRDLKQLRAWLKNCKVTEIAMESTGQYWRPIWNLLEGHFEKLLLVNPQHIKGLNGYKTDPKDARWIADLLESDKLKGSWVPPRDIRELRDLTRQRVHVMEDQNRVKNRIEQLCQTGNIKVSSVASDLFGVSGRRMLKAIVEGKRDPGWMADYARGTLRGKKQELELALNGSFTDSQRWLLDKQLQHLEWLEKQVQGLEQEIERRVACQEEPMRRLMTIPGIDRKTAWTLVAELGVDMSVFADAQHLASWAGLCPANRESGGKADEWTDTQSQQLREAGDVSIGLGRFAYQKDLAALVLPAHPGAQGRAQSGDGPGASYAGCGVQRSQAERRIRRVGWGLPDQRNKPKLVSRLVERLTRLGYHVDLKPVESHSSEQPNPVADLVPDLPSEQPQEMAAIANDTPAVAESTAPRKPKRGRPCKCIERGIICKHGSSIKVNSLKERAHNGS